MLEQRCGFDRRTMNDRRQVYEPSYLMPGAVDRRSWTSRRRTPQVERRTEWIRVTEWTSIPVRKPMQHLS